MVDRWEIEVNRSPAKTCGIRADRAGDTIERYVAAAGKMPFGKGDIRKSFQLTVRRPIPLARQQVLAGVLRGSCLEVGSGCFTDDLCCVADTRGSTYTPRLSLDVPVGEWLFCGRPLL